MKRQFITVLDKNPVRGTKRTVFECKVCGETNYVINDWVKNPPCGACESHKKTREQKEAWVAYFNSSKGE